MPSPDAGSVDLPILTFGGKVSQYDAQSLPMGASPFNRDVSFSGVTPNTGGMVTGVAQRPGMSPFYATPFAANPSINYLKTFVDSSEIFHLLSLDGLGVMRDESPCPTVPGVPAIIGNVTAASIAQSDTLFGREWIAISNEAHPGFGIDIPRQWDGQNFDRVSQVGPGAPPAAIDEALSFTVSAAGVPGAQMVSVSTIIGLGASQVGNIVTLLLAQNGIVGPQVGDKIVVAGVGVGGYNGTFTLASIQYSSSTPNVFLTYYNPISGLAPSGGGTVNFQLAEITTTTNNSFSVGQLVTTAGITVAGYNVASTMVRIRYSATSFAIYIGTNGLANSGGGTASPVGNIPVGLHQLSVSFITRKNYITKPAPFGSFVASGGLRAVVSSIPIGPSNIIGRILIFTPVITPPATGGPFFYFDGAVPTPSAGTFPSMVILDNTTTQYTVDFSDAVLQLGTAATNLFNLLELGECASVVSYSGRTFWAGERNKVSNFNNLTFDGGTGTIVTLPLGWTSDPTNGAGGSMAVAGGQTAYWGDAFVVTGDGATALRGMITQTAYQDYLGVPIVNINTGYSVRLRAYKSAGLVQGKITIELFSASAGSIGLFSVDESILTGNYQEFIGVLCTAQVTIPADAVLRVYGSNTLTNAQYIVVDCIEVYPTLVPYNNLVRVSYAEDPESFDALTGIIIIGAAQGQSVRRLFTLLDNKLYPVTERGIFVTQDDGANEPSSWAVNTVSSTVGTGSVNGVAVAESWAIIASHDGAYIFWGSEPVKITQEIQPDWDQINFNFDQTIYVAIDTSAKRIHIGVPVGEINRPNQEFVCDFAQLANAESATAAQDIAAHPQAYYSVYNPTKVVAPGKARKWTIWYLNDGSTGVGMNCAALTIRSDGSYHLLRGNGAGTGKIYDQLTSQLTDDGAFINSLYQTAYFPQIEDEQALQLGSHRKHFKYLTGWVQGSGQFQMTVYGARNLRAKSLTTMTLSTTQEWDFEMNAYYIAERMSLLFGALTTGGWWELSKLTPTIQRELISPVRGVM